MYNLAMERSRQLLKVLTEAFSDNGKQALPNQPWQASQVNQDLIIEHLRNNGFTSHDLDLLASDPEQMRLLYQTAETLHIRHKVVPARPELEIVPVVLREITTLMKESERN